MHSGRIVFSQSMDDLPHIVVFGLPKLLANRNRHGGTQKRRKVGTRHTVPALTDCQPTAAPDSRRLPLFTASDIVPEVLDHRLHHPLLPLLGDDLHRRRVRSTRVEPTP